MYYTSESAHGSESSRGFSNDIIVRAFNTKQNRDQYVANSKNITVRAILRTDATRQANNWSLTRNCDSAPKPFSGEFWAIVEPFDGPVSDGHIGNVGCCNDGDYNIVKRFY